MKTIKNRKRKTSPRILLNNIEPMTHELNIIKWLRRSHSGSANSTKPWKMNLNHFRQRSWHKTCEINLQSRAHTKKKKTFFRLFNPESFQYMWNEIDEMTHNEYIFWCVVCLRGYKMKTHNNNSLFATTNNNNHSLKAKCCHAFQTSDCFRLLRRSHQIDEFRSDEKQSVVIDHPEMYYV